jgi:hypothetical protein
LFYQIQKPDASMEDMVRFLGKYDPGIAKVECRQAIQNAIVTHFGNHPISSVPPQSIEFSVELRIAIARLSLLIAAGRQQSLEEGPHRVGLLLRLICQGSALISGRSAVDASDIDLARHVAVSTIPPGRRGLIQTLGTKGIVYMAEKPLPGMATKFQLEDLCSTGIGQWQRGNSVVPAPDFEWMKGVIK